MGSSLSSLPPLSPLTVAVVTAEYHRLVCSPPCTATALCSTSPLPPLSFTSLLAFALPPYLPLTLSHLSTLYTLQSLSPTLDGRVTLPLLLDFLQWSEAKSTEWRTNERQSKLEAVFAVHMATQAAKQGGGGAGGEAGGVGGGAQHLAQWLVYSVVNDGGQGKGRVKESRGGGALAHRDQVRQVHQLLRSYLPPSCSFPSLFDDLQQSAEQQSLLDLDDLSLDDYIPVPTLTWFLSHFFAGSLSMFSAVGLYEGNDATSGGQSALPVGRARKASREAVVSSQSARR